jgi:hypothetical protein
MIPRLEKFVVTARTPKNGEQITNRELAYYIREAVRVHWPWGKRITWTVRR